MSNDLKKPQEPGTLCEKCGRRYIGEAYSHSLFCNPAPSPVDPVEGRRERAEKLVDKLLASNTEGYYSTSFKVRVAIEISAFASQECQLAEQSAAIDKEINAHHSALIGKIQAVVDKAFPNSRWADYDVLNQGVHQILERAEAAEQALARAQAALRIAQIHPGPLTYPFTCCLCDKVIDGWDGTEGHGLGECVELCDKCDGSGSPDLTFEKLRQRLAAALNTQEETR